MYPNFYLCTQHTSLNTDTIVQLLGAEGICQGNTSLSVDSIIYHGPVTIKPFVFVMYGKLTDNVLS
jgi:hypothetical protein